MNKASFVNHDEPLLCAMIQCETVEECICKIKASLAEDATAFGIQLCKIKKELRTKENLTKIFEACEGRPIYVTSYRHSQNEGFTDEQCVEVLLLAIESGATIVDIMGDMYDRGAKWELTENPEAVKKQKALIEKIHALGGEVLMSSHTSSNLTVEETLHIAKSHEERGADLVKIVNKTDAIEDLPKSFETIIELNKTLNKKFLYLESGPTQKLVRNLGPQLGVCTYLTCQSYGVADTPAQPKLTRLKKVIEGLDY